MYVFWKNRDTISYLKQITKEAGVGRESLYKSLDRNVNPSFHTIMKGSCTLSAAG